MKQTLIYQLRPDVVIEDQENGGFSLAVAAGKLEIKSRSETVRAAIERLQCPGASEDELTAMIQDAGEGEILAIFLYSLEQIKRAGLLQYIIGRRKRPVATILPISTLFRMESISLEAGKLYQLSRFAFVRMEADGLVLESPRSYARINLESQRAMQFLATMGNPAELDSSLPEKRKNLRQLAELMLGLGFLTEVNAEGVAAEDENPALQQWEFHDLLFHSRSRMGRHSNPCGASYPFRGKVEPTPASKEMPDNLETIALYKPDMTAILQNDLPFSQVLEGRKSVRKYGNKPLSVGQLGEFLYRACRMRDFHPKDPENGQFYETSNRPYPNGGASYEFELYLTINECEGLASGLYHYDPKAHVLRKLRERDIFVEALLTDGWLSAAQTTVPQVLITYAPRFQRLSWKYRGMGYSASLKNAGALYQTMYLVATAMGLAPCGLGNGNAELLSRAAGTDFFEESSTAEFMLGSRPQE